MCFDRGESRGVDQIGEEMDGWRDCGETQVKFWNISAFIRKPSVAKTPWTL